MSILTYPHITSADSGQAQMMMRVEARDVLPQHKDCIEKHWNFENATFSILFVLPSDAGLHG